MSYPALDIFHRDAPAPEELLARTACPPQNRC